MGSSGYEPCQWIFNGVKRGEDGWFTILVDRADVSGGYTFVGDMELIHSRVDQIAAPLLRARGVTVVDGVIEGAYRVSIGDIESFAREAVAFVNDKIKLMVDVLSPDFMPPPSSLRCDRSIQPAYKSPRFGVEFGPLVAKDCVYYAIPVHQSIINGLGGRL